MGWPCDDYTNESTPKSHNHMNDKRKKTVAFLVEWVDCDNCGENKTKSVGQVGMGAERSLMIKSHTSDMYQPQSYQNQFIFYDKSKVFILVRLPTAANNNEQCCEENE